MSGREKKIAVAMSGGVDSSVTACLLREEGFQVGGVFMALAQPDLDSQVDRVRRVADQVGIPLEVIDLSADFEREVLCYFAESYRLGRTPNPCMVCNPQVKFGRLLDEAAARGFTHLATGHYARLEHDAAGRTRLMKGADPGKDQSYFLARLGQRQLSRLLFPLGGFLKSEVYGLAARFGIAGVHGQESQDVCFLKDATVAGFLAGRGVPDSPGPVLNEEGETVGRHLGLHHFTIGQRRGLGIPDATPYYVLALDPARNAVVVGKKEGLFSSRLFAKNPCWTQEEAPSLPARFDVRIRYRGQPAPAWARPAGAERIEIVFDEPQRAVTPGQFAVLYLGDEVAGAAEILYS